MSRSNSRIGAAIIALALLGGIACADRADNTDRTVSPTGVGETRLLHVVATTTHIADMTREIAGDRAAVESLAPANADAHAFEPTPGDMKKVVEADLVLQHGMEFDAWAESLVSQSGSDAVVAIVTEGIEPREHDDDQEAEGTAEAGHEHGDVDPHVWFDVANARIMAANIRDALSDVDPDGARTYERNATAYLGELDELDRWIRARIATIPEANRRLVTNHDAFRYYVSAYGLEFVGSVIPSLDSQAQPSARETAELIDAIKAQGVKAIFTEASINPDLARQLASEAGVVVVDDLYGDSLGPPGSGADTYIGMMRTNTTAIVEALR